MLILHITINKLHTKYCALTFTQTTPYITKTPNIKQGYRHKILNGKARAENEVIEFFFFFFFSYSFRCILEHSILGSCSTVDKLASCLDCTWKNIPASSVPKYGKKNTVAMATAMKYVTGTAKAADSLDRLHLPHLKGYTVQGPLVIV